MDEFTAETFANRDEPIPVVSDSGHGRKQSKDRFSVSSLKERFRTTTSFDGNGPGVLSIQDRMFAKLLEQVIPVEGDVDDNESVGAGPKRVEQPPFSLPTMGNNFRRFNARIGIVFEFQIKAAKLFSWRRPSHTWSFLAVYSFVCLNPNLLPVLPMVMMLLCIMVPAFISRHPAPPPTASTSSTTPYYSYEGPALAPASTIKPVPETSKDFFHNLRDLQNSMADFSVLHDTIVSTLGPITNFSDEVLSSTAFLLLTASAALLFLTAHLIPWRFIFLIGGNAGILASHPTIEALIERLKESSDSASDAATAPGNQEDHITILGHTLPTTLPAVSSSLQSLSAITMDTHSEEREVEIFELQHKLHSPYSMHGEWEPFVFTPTPYDPLSPSRIAGDRPRGTRFFEDVQPPRGWEWKGKKWELDLDCGEWVLERMVTGVEFEVAGEDEEEVGGWVWDLPFDAADGGLRDDSKGGDEKGKGKGKDLEETTHREERVGEWRRRRWVRVVQRVQVDE